MADRDAWATVSMHILLVAIIAESCQNLFSVARYIVFELYVFLLFVMFALCTVAVINPDHSGPSSGSPASVLLDHFTFGGLYFGKLHYLNSVFSCLEYLP